MTNPTINDITRLQLNFDSELFLEKRAENNASGDPIYVGWAKAGSDVSAANWYIMKILYDGNAAMVQALIANNAPKFAYVWDDRATYFT